MKLAAVGFTLVSLATPALAQPGNVEPTPEPAPIEAPPQPTYAQPTYAAPPPVAQHDTVDPDVAMGLSLGGTVLSWGMLIAASRDNSQSEGLATAGAIGTLFAPSFGHWYAHHGFSRGLGLRLLGVATATVAFAMAMDDLLDEDGSNSDEGTVAGLMLVSAGLYVGGTIDDIATAGSAARKYNSRFENVGFVPTMNQHGGGVSVVGRF